MQVPVHDALDQALLVEVLLLGVDQQTLQVLHAEGNLGLVVGLHDGHGDDRVRVTHQLPRVDLLEHLAVLDLDGAARVLLLLQVDDGDALVAQLLIAALGNRQLRVGAGRGGLRDHRLRAEGLHGLVDGQAHLPAGHAAGEPVGRTGHQIRLDDNLVAGLDDVLDAADVGDHLVDRRLDGRVIVAVRLANRYSRHSSSSFIFLRVCVQTEW